MDTRKRDRINHILSSDEAPDTGDDSDEDLVTNHLINGSGSAVAMENLVPTIHITPQSPNGNHVLEDNLLQLSRIQERIQEMRIANAQGNLNIRDNRGRLSTSCPSLNESLEALASAGDKTDNANYRSKIRSKNDNNANKQNQRSKMHRKHRSVSVSSGDSEDDTDTVDASAAQKVRQRSASQAPKEMVTPTHKESRFYNRHKSPHLVAQFPSLHKSVSTPSIVVENSGKKKKHGRDLPEPTHVFLQRLIADHELPRPSGSDSDTDDDQHAGHQPPTAVRSVSTVGHPPADPPRIVRPHPLAAHHNSTPSPQLSLAEFLQVEPSLEDDDDSRKRRRKKERSSIFFRKKKDKIGNSVSNIGKPTAIQHQHLMDAQQQQGKGGLAKVSSSINLGSRGPSGPHTEVTRGSKMSQSYSHSMSSLRKQSISAPSHTVPIVAPSSGGNSNFYVNKSEFGRGFDDRDDVGHEDTIGLWDNEVMPGEEFAMQAMIRDLETPSHLRIEEDEPETWTKTVSTAIISKLSHEDIKRQENIYEIILTESNHCQVLMVIQKIFVEGMYKHLYLTKETMDQLFPQIDVLIDLHFQFLEDLRNRQKQQEPVVETIADILHHQFSGANGERWREAYGSFCSGHSKAISVFKDLMKSDRRFQQFVRQCSENPLLKKKGVPECILFVTTRITKYPLLIERYSKSAIKDRPAEFELLRQAHNFVKDIVKDVNSLVATKEREQRLVEICSKLDPKSTLLHNGKKYRKSDLSLEDRKLMFEGVALLHQRKGSLQVNVIVLSDYMFFLQENNGKFYFASPEGKSALIDVKTLIAKERSGSSKALNLLSTEGFESDPEVYEVEISRPPTRDDWITGIREAVDAASPGSDSEPDHEQNLENRKSVENKYLHLRRLTAELRGKDIELSHVLESKMKIMNEILDIVQEGNVDQMIKPDYLSIVREKKTTESSEVSKEQLLLNVQEASRLASSIFSSVSNLSRSVSSAGEKHSNEYSSPSLPRRAETFSGFDSGGKPKIKEIDIGDGAEREIISQPPPVEAGPKKDHNLPGPQPLLMSLEPEQQQAAVQMTHYMNNLMCMVAEHFTSLETIKAELKHERDKANYSVGRYKENQRFEDMRNLQETLAQEKKEWLSQKEGLEAECEAKKAEMGKYQAEIDLGLKDVKEQREQLYRKLEVLRAQGIELGPNLSVLKNDPSPQPPSKGDHLIYHEVNTPSSQASTSHSPSSSGGHHHHHGHSGSSIRKSSSLTSSSSAILTPANSVLTGGSLKKESFGNLHLMSATKETKALDKQEIKQQIPVKLSSLSKESIKAKKSTAALNSQSTVAPSAKGISNLAKPEAVQQLLPFKLSEDGKSPQGLNSGTNRNHQQQQQRYHQQQYYQQHVHHPHSKHHLSGLPGGSLRYSSSSTLPKAGSVQKVTNYGTTTSGNAGRSGNSSGANSDDDKVIYF